MTVNLTGLHSFRDSVLSVSGPMRDAFIQWGALYRSFVRLRFRNESRGGGDWPRLARSTLAARRRKKVKLRTKTGRRRKFKMGSSVLITKAPKILIDTGILIGALSPRFERKPGQLQKNLSDGIRVGFGGPAKHPAKPGEKSPPTISDIASWHQKGNRINNLPQRRIIVDPNEKTLRRMSSLMDIAIKRTAKEGV